MHNLSHLRARPVVLIESGRVVKRERALARMQGVDYVAASDAQNLLLEASAVRRDGYNYSAAGLASLLTGAAFTVQRLGHAAFQARRTADNLRRKKRSR